MNVKYHFNHRYFTVGKYPIIGNNILSNISNNRYLTLTVLLIFNKHSNFESDVSEWLLDTDEYFNISCLVRCKQ